MKHEWLNATLAAALLAASTLPSSAAEPLRIARQGVFSSGGRVTKPIPGD